MVMQWLRLWRRLVQYPLYNSFLRWATLSVLLQPYYWFERIRFDGKFLVQRMLLLMLLAQVLIIPQYVLVNTIGMDHTHFHPGATPWRFGFFIFMIINSAGPPEGIGWGLRKKKQLQSGCDPS
jgi:hypothetical protein